VNGDASAISASPQRPVPAHGRSTSGNSQAAHQGPRYLILWLAWVGSATEPGGTGAHPDSDSGRNHEYSRWFKGSIAPLLWSTRPRGLQNGPLKGGSSRYYSWLGHGDPGFHQSYSEVARGLNGPPERGRYVAPGLTIGLAGASPCLAPPPAAPDPGGRVSKFGALAGTELCLEPGGGVMLTTGSNTGAPGKTAPRQRVCLTKRHPPNRPPTTQKNTQL
jgi:hypothetical protein